MGGPHPRPSKLRCTNCCGRHSGQHVGQHKSALERARHAKEATYPELAASERSRLVVLAIETGGQWCEEAVHTIQVLGLRIVVSEALRRLPGQLLRRRQSNLSRRCGVSCDSCCGSGNLSSICLASCLLAQSQAASCPRAIQQLHRALFLQQLREHFLGGLTMKVISGSGVSEVTVWTTLSPASSQSLFPREVSPRSFSATPLSTLIGSLWHFAVFETRSRCARVHLLHCVTSSFLHIEVAVWTTAENHTLELD